MCAGNEWLGVTPINVYVRVSIYVCASLHTNVYGARMFMLPLYHSLLSLWGATPRKATQARVDIARPITIARNISAMAHTHTHTCVHIHVWVSVFANEEDLPRFKNPLLFFSFEIQSSRVRRREQHNWGQPHWLQRSLFETDHHFLADILSEEKKINPWPCKIHLFLAFGVLWVSINSKSPPKIHRFRCRLI